MTREEKNFTKEYYKVFYRLYQKVKQAQFDRFKNDEFKLDTIDIEPSENKNPTKLTLVR
jgi:hypothetical protein